MNGEHAARLRSDLGTTADIRTLLEVVTGAAACSACIYWDADGTCRRNAPRPKIDGTPVWPRTGGDGWCGDFRA